MTLEQRTRHFVPFERGNAGRRLLWVDRNRSLSLKPRKILHQSAPPPPGPGVNQFPHHERKIQASRTHEINNETRDSPSPLGENGRPLLAPVPLPPKQPQYLCKLPRASPHRSPSPTKTKFQTRPWLNAGAYARETERGGRPVRLSGDEPRRRRAEKTTTQSIKSQGVAGERTYHVLRTTHELSSLLRASFSRVEARRPTGSIEADEAPFRETTDRDRENSRGFHGKSSTATFPGLWDSSCRLLSAYLIQGGGLNTHINQILSQRFSLRQQSWPWGDKKRKHYCRYHQSLPFVFHFETKNTRPFFASSLLPPPSPLLGLGWLSHLEPTSSGGVGTYGGLNSRMSTCRLRQSRMQRARSQHTTSKGSTCQIKNRDGTRTTGPLRWRNAANTYSRR